MYISRVCKRVWPGVTGPRKEEGEQDRHGLQGPLVLVMQGRFGCDLGDMLLSAGSMGEEHCSSSQEPVVPKVEGSHVLETHPRNGVKGGQGALAIC